jgi:HD-like signal output (HDOD) protein
MRHPSASVESSAASPSSTFPLPDAALVTAAWSDLLAAGVFPSRPDKAKTVSGAMLHRLGALVLHRPME